MADFTRFQDLAPELRRMIWRHALEEESSRRIVLVHRESLRISKWIPSLISPLMLTTRESRLCAKDFYNVRVDVYAVPPVAPDWDHFRDWCSDLCDGDDDDDDVEDPGWERTTEWWWSYGHFAAGHDAVEMLTRRPNLATDQLQGAVFVSTDWDCFALSFQAFLEPDPESHFVDEMNGSSDEYIDICAAHFTFDTQKKLLGSQSSYPWLEHRKEQWRHASAPLAPEVCHMVRNVIATFEIRGDRSHLGDLPVYKKEDAVLHWRTDAFDAIGNYLRLRVDNGWTFIKVFTAGKFDKFDVRSLKELDDRDEDVDEWMLL
ncbi:hypothetical protein PG997_002028 [Apiospora hydei]|uniref:2EXR domain-containing protein n=1 Tax=Apiospora hydei TaxID=1337664 RepID=A0ABR1X880_9PEZI